MRVILAVRGQKRMVTSTWTPAFQAFLKVSVRFQYQSTGFVCSTPRQSERYTTVHD